MLKWLQIVLNGISLYHLHLNFRTFPARPHIEYGQFFTLAQPHYGLRGHEKKLAKARSRLDTRKHFFSQRVVNVWNSLPAEVVNAGSVNSF